MARQNDKDGGGKKQKVPAWVKPIGPAKPENKVYGPPKPPKKEKPGDIEIPKWLNPANNPANPTPNYGQYNNSPYLGFQTPTTNGFTAPPRVGPTVPAWSIPPTVPKYSNPNGYTIGQAPQYTIGGQANGVAPFFQAQQNMDALRTIPVRERQYPYFGFQTPTTGTGNTPPLTIDQMRGRGTNRLGPLNPPAGEDYIWVGSKRVKRPEPVLSVNDMRGRGTNRDAGFMITPNYVPQKTTSTGGSSGGGTGGGYKKPSYSGGYSGGGYDGGGYSYNDKTPSWLMNLYNWQFKG